jgi:hypothetical protein
VKWLEIIHIRTTENKSELLIGELTRLLSDIREETDELQIVLLRHATLPIDLGLHLIHHLDQRPPRKSDIGFRISSAMKEFGLVHHSVWVPEYTIGNASLDDRR